MPPLSGVFGQQVAAALAVAEVVEVARVEAASGSNTRRHLYPARLELVYELAYLRVFVAWETFLEETFLRYLCGYDSVRGQAPLAPGEKYRRTLLAAEQDVLGGRQYKLWHNPSEVLKRSGQFFDATKETMAVVLSSNLAEITNMAAVRHRIAHGNDDARRKFDSATMTLAGKRYRAAKAGAFLRDHDRSATPPIRWLERLGKQLGSLAGQIA